MPAKLTPQEVSFFWETVVPFFGLDESFDYDESPELIRENIEAYDKSLGAAGNSVTQRAVKLSDSGLHAKDAVLIDTARGAGFELAENLHTNAGFFFRRENDRDDTPTTFPTIAQAWAHCCELHEMSPTPKVGLFVGKILDITDDVVTQRVGRAGETVLHAVSDLSANVVVGDVAEIAYRGEAGVVMGSVRELAR